MPDFTGFGDYTESGQVIPVKFNGEEGGYSHAMFLNDGPPIYGGRELWGFPKKYAQPCLSVDKDTLIGTLNYGSVRVATATMGFKHKAIDQAEVRAGLERPNYLLKIIPHVDGKVRILELIDYRLEDIIMKGAWSGPATLELEPHALAPSRRCPCAKSSQPPSTSLPTSHSDWARSSTTISLRRASHETRRQGCP